MVTTAGQQIAMQANSNVNQNVFGSILFNVRAYGAKGDFNTTTKIGTDDTAAVNATIAAAAVSGGTVHFPPGIYRITSTVLLDATKNNIRFTGDGALYWQTAVDQPVFDIRGTNIKFENLTFYSDPAYTRRNSGGFLYLNGCSYVYVNECTLRDSPNAGIYMDSAANNIQVIGNMIHDSKADGIHMVNGTHDVVVEGNRLYNTGDDSISVVWYSGSTFGVPKDILIEGNLTRGSLGGGITVCHGQRVTIVGNVIVDTTLSGILMYPGGNRTELTDGISVKSNTLRNIGKSSQKYGIYGHQISNTVIMDNDIDTTFDAGILLGHHQNVKVKGNTIKNAGSSGIGCPQVSYTTGASGLTIEENIIDSPVYVAINISPPSGANITNVNIFGNKVMNNCTNRTSANYIIADQVNGLRVYDNSNDNADQMYVSPACTNFTYGNNYPQQWRTYTPTITPSTGAITTYTANGYYERKGNTIHLFIDATITTNGTGAVSLQITLPVNALSTRNSIMVGREDALTGKSLVGILKTSTVNVTFYDNTYPGANGAVIRMSGSYEIA